MNITKSLYPLCPLWPKSLVLISVHSWFNFVSFVHFVVKIHEENVTKLSQIQNEPKTNPNEPNFLEVKPHSKPKKQHLDQNL